MQQGWAEDNVQVRIGGEESLYLYYSEMLMILKWLVVHIGFVLELANI